MKRKFIKIFGVLFALSLLMALPSVHQFAFKKIVSVVSAYKVESLQGVHLKLFPFTLQVDSAQIAAKKSQTNINLSKAEIKFLGGKWFLASEIVTYQAAETKEIIDTTSFTPEVLAKFLQHSFATLKDIAVIKINKLRIDSQELAVTLEQKNDQITGQIIHAGNVVNISCNAKKIIASGTWQGYPISFQCNIEENAISFEGKTVTYHGMPEFLKDSLGDQLFLKGKLVHNKEWNLENFELTSSNHHKISGSCTQKREQLNGLFNWTIPANGKKTETVCQIMVKGFAQQPNISVQFIKGIEPLKSLAATLDIIDKNHLKVTANAFYNKSNQAACNFDISLAQFTLNGIVDADVQKLEKLMHNFFPGFRGQARIKGEFVDCRNFNDGLLDLSWQMNIYSQNLNIPFLMSCKIKNGEGQGGVKISKGKYYSLPLDLNIKFIGNGDSVNVSQLSFALAELKINLTKAFVYDFAKGAENVNLQCLGGTVAIKNVLLSRTIIDSTLAVKLGNIQLKHLSPLLENGDLSGVMNAEFTKLPDTPSQGSITFSNVNWQKRQNNQLYRVIENLNCSLKTTSDGKKVEWNLTAKDNDKIDINSAGKVTLAEHQLDGSLKGMLKLKLLNDMLATGDRIYGDISLNVHFKGDIASPTFEGYVNADNGLYEHNEVGTYYQNIIIRTQAQGKRFVVKQFTAQDIRKSSDPNFAQLKGEGWVDFTNLLEPEFNVHLHMLRLRIAQHDGFISDATGTLTLLGKGSEVGCKGEATLENATYFLDQGAEGKVQTIENRKNKKSKNNKSKEYATAFPLDILIHCPENTFKVMGMGANTIWKGDFYVKKSIANPFLVGTVHLQEGTIDVLGRVLKLTKGAVTFVDDDRNNPRLDIVASQNMGDGLTVSMEIKGTGDNTVIDFNSTPQLQKEEILSLLVFGKRLGEVSVLQSMQLASLVKADNKQGDSFFSKLRSGFGFDELEFKTVTTGGASANDADATPQERAAAKTAQAVRIGKDFGKVRVAVEQGTGTANSKVVVSTPLGKNLALQGDVGSAQNSGVGISWIKRY